MASYHKPCFCILDRATASEQGLTHWQMWGYHKNRCPYLRKLVSIFGNNFIDKVGRPWSWCLFHNIYTEYVQKIFHILSDTTLCGKFHSSFSGCYQVIPTSSSNSGLIHAYQVTLDISGSPIESQWGSWNVQGNSTGMLFAHDFWSLGNLEDWISNYHHKFAWNYLVLSTENIQIPVWEYALKAMLYVGHKTNHI